MRPFFSLNRRSQRVVVVERRAMITIARPCSYYSKLAVRCSASISNAEVAVTEKMVRIPQ